MSATEDLRRELESEWMAQHKILAWPNWLQDQLLKSRQERQAAYSQGYKDALKWIPVEERLPPEQERVLLWFLDGGQEWRCRFGEINCGHWRPDGGNGNFDSHVSHWMPLPEAPRSLPIPEAK